MRKNNRQTLLQGGAWVPSVTLFHGGTGRRVNITATLHHLITLAKHGAEGVVINGTTGEGHLLAHQDKVSLIKEVGEARINKKFPGNFVLISGTGTDRIEEAEEITHTAQRKGFHGLLVLPPKQGDKEAFFHRLGDVSKGRMGILLYHHPRLDPEYAVSPQLLARLMRDHSAIVGVKDSSGNQDLLHRWQPVAQEVAGHPALLAVGEDFFVAEGLQKAGAQAAIAGAANTPKGLKELQAIFAAHRAGQPEAMKAAQARFDQEINSLLKKGIFRDNAKRRRIRD